MIDFSNWFRGTRCVVSGCCLISLLVGVAPAEGQDASGWQAIELYRLGGIDAPPEEEFTNQLLSLSLGPNDQLFVLDLSSSRIQVFSAANGEYVRTIARAGRGPGEILDATGLGWDRDDQLWVKEPFARRYSVFDSTGTFIRTVPRPWSPVPSRTGRVDFDEEGRLVETAIEDSGPFLRVLDPTSGELIDEYSVLPASQRHPALPSSIVGVPDNVVQAVRRFQPRVIWDWLPDGRVWFAHEDDYRLFALNALGDTLAVMEGAARTREFTDREAGMVDQARRHLRADDSLFSPPQLQRMIRLPDGHLLIQRPEELNEPGRAFDILAPDGDYVGSLSLPMPVWRNSGFAVRDDRLFVVGRSEFDVPVVLAMSLRR